MSNSEHLPSPEPRTPYADTADADLLYIYDRATIYPDSPELPDLMVELRRRGLVE